MTDISASCKAHIPQNWQTKDVLIDDSERLQLNKNFGLKSGTWSVCGDDLITNQRGYFTNQGDINKFRTSTNLEIG